MSFLLTVLAMYCLLGLVPPLLATVVDGFWAKVLEGAQYEDPAKHAAMVSAFDDVGNLFFVVTRWPLILWMALRLYRIRLKIAEIREDCDDREAMVEAVPGGVLAREIDHPTDCMLCRVDHRACRTLAVFHCGNRVDEGKAAILDQNKGIFAETRLVSKRGDKFFIYSPAIETPTETIHRLTLTHMIRGASEEEAISRAVLDFVTRSKGEKGV